MAIMPKPTFRFKNKKFFLAHFIADIRRLGGAECWVLNKKFLEIYHFKATQISDFDAYIELSNSLTKELVYSGMFVLHMREIILDLLNEVPGTVFMNKLDCYRELHMQLYNRFKRTIVKEYKEELIEKINYIEEHFPQFII